MRHSCKDFRDFSRIGNAICKLDRHGRTARRGPFLLVIPNSAGLSQFVDRLEDEPKLVISAAAQAQKGVYYILNRQPEIETPVE